MLNQHEKDKSIDNRSDLEKINKGTVIALGMFDGVHLGHRSLLQRAIELAQSHGFESMAYTFTNHPAGSSMLLSRNEAFSRIKEVGIDVIEADEFNNELKKTAPEDFVRMLLSRFSMKAAVVGFNYTFGKGGKATAETLQRLGREMGFMTEVLPGVKYEGRLVSSTLIRGLIESGQVESANVLLKKPYSIEGRVVKGRQIGRDMGFPTANICDEAILERVIPAYGVYAALAFVDGDKTAYRAVTNVGNNPTVGGAKTTIETHFLNFSGELYDKNIRVELLKELRGLVRFEGRAELSEQISRDVLNTRAYFRENGAGVEVE